MGKLGRKRFLRGSHGQNNNKSEGDINSNATQEQDTGESEELEQADGAVSTMNGEISENRRSNFVAPTLTGKKPLKKMLSNQDNNQTNRPHKEVLSQEEGELSEDQSQDESGHKNSNSIPDFVKPHLVQDISSENSALPRFLLCPLCRDLLLDPLVLPCFHTICGRKCVPKLTQDGYNLWCPQCKTMHNTQGGVDSLMPAETFGKMSRQIREKKKQGGGNLESGGRGNNHDHGISDRQGGMGEQGGNGDNSEDDLTCRICNNLFGLPVRLPCGHSICKSPCATRNLMYNFKICCPVCERPAYLNGGINSLPIAENLVRRLKVIKGESYLEKLEMQEAEEGESDHNTPSGKRGRQNRKDRRDGRRDRKKGGDKGTGWDNIPSLMDNMPSLIPDEELNTRMRQFDQIEQKNVPSLLAMDLPAPPSLLSLPQQEKKRPPPPPSKMPVNAAAQSQIIDYGHRMDPDGPGSSSLLDEVARHRSGGLLGLPSVPVIAGRGGLLQHPRTLRQGAVPSIDEILAETDSQHQRASASLFDDAPSHRLGAHSLMNEPPPQRPGPSSLFDDAPLHRIGSSLFEDVLPTHAPPPLRGHRGGAHLQGLLDHPDVPRPGLLKHPRALLNHPERPLGPLTRRPPPELHDHHHGLTNQPLNPIEHHSEPPPPNQHPCGLMGNFPVEEFHPNQHPPGLMDDFSREKFIPNQNRPGLIDDFPTQEFSGNQNRAGLMDNFADEEFPPNQHPPSLMELEHSANQHPPGLMDNFQNQEQEFESQSQARRNARKQRRKQNQNFNQDQGEEFHQVQGEQFNQDQQEQFHEQPEQPKPQPKAEPEEQKPIPHIDDELLLTSEEPIAAQIMGISWDGPKRGRLGVMPYQQQQQGKKRSDYNNFGKHKGEQNNYNRKGPQQRNGADSNGDQVSGLVREYHHGSDPIPSLLDLPPGPPPGPFGPGMDGPLYPPGDMGPPTHPPPHFMGPPPGMYHSTEVPGVNMVAPQQGVLASMLNHSGSGPPPIVNYQSPAVSSSEGTEDVGGSMPVTMPAVYAPAGGAAPTSLPVMDPSTIPTMNSAFEYQAHWTKFVQQTMAYYNSIYAAQGGTPPEAQQMINDYLSKCWAWYSAFTNLCLVNPEYKEASKPEPPKPVENDDLSKSKKKKKNKQAAKAAAAAAAAAAAKKASDAMQDTDVDPGEIEELKIMLLKKQLELKVKHARNKVELRELLNMKKLVIEEEGEEKVEEISEEEREKVKEAARQKQLEREKEIERQEKERQTNRDKEIKKLQEDRQKEKALEYERDRIREMKERERERRREQRRDRRSRDYHGGRRRSRSRDRRRRRRSRSRSRTMSPSRSRSNSPNSDSNRKDEEKEEPKDEEPKYIKVTNLPDDIKAVELKSFVEAFGRVLNCKIGKMQGEMMAVIHMASLADAMSCVRDMHGSQFKGKILDIKYMGNKPNMKEVEVSIPDVYSGPSAKAKGDATGFNAKPIAGPSFGYEGPGYYKAPEIKNIWLGNLPWGSLEDDIMRLVAHHARPLDCKIGTNSDPNNRGLFAIVTMESYIDVLKCINSLHGIRYEGRVLEVKKMKY